jgi:hypothetical protein
MALEKFTALRVIQRSRRGSKYDSMLLGTRNKINKKDKS